MVLDLVGVAEIAEMLKVTRQRVDAIIRTRDDFPAPEAELKGGRVWQKSDVVAWARRNGRSIANDT